MPTLTVDAGALTLTGESVGGDWTLAVTAGALTLAGETISPTWVMPIAHATLSLTGENIGGATITMAVEAATLSLAGDEILDLGCQCLQTSQQYTFGADTEVVDIITEAYERCGIDGPSISATMLDSARRSMMFMFSEWANRGPTLPWVYLYELTLVPGQQSYVLPANTIYVVNAATRQTQSNCRNVDLMIGPISRSEYLALPDKCQTSARPTQFYLERSTIPVIYPWPVLQSGSCCTLLLYLLRMTQDIAKFCGAADGPQRLMDAIAAGLASRLAAKYAWDRRDALKMDAEEAFGFMATEDRERVPYRITIDNPWGP